MRTKSCTTIAAIRGRPRTLPPWRTTRTWSPGCAPCCASSTRREGCDLLKTRATHLAIVWQLYQLKSGE